MKSNMKKKIISNSNTSSDKLNKENVELLHQEKDGEENLSTNLSADDADLICNEDDLKLSSSNQNLSTKNTFEKFNSYKSTLQYDSDNQKVVTKKLISKKRINNENSSDKNTKSLHNFSDFGNLHFDRRITKAITTYFKFKTPTLVQSKMIPIALKRKDLLVKAKTGSGKTLGYAIPTIHYLLTQFEKENKMQSLKTLILVPTKELVEQVYNVFKILISYCEDVISVDNSTSLLRNENFHYSSLPTVLICTPTSLLDILNNFSSSISSQSSQFNDFNQLNVNYSKSFSSIDLRNTVETIIVDEADLMFSFGFHSSMQKITQLLPSASSRHFQVILCSATLTEDVIKLKSFMLYKPVILKLEKEIKSEKNVNIVDNSQISNIDSYNNNMEDKQIDEHNKNIYNSYNQDQNIDNLDIIDTLKDGNITQYYHICRTTTDKFLIIYSLITLQIIPHRIIIFTNTIERAYRLMIFLENFSISSSVLNTSMPFSSRHNIIQEFNQHLLNILIATEEDIKEELQENNNKDFVALHRGLDLQDIEFVINFDTPLTADSYIHRVGRTGRGGTDGTALTLACIDEGEEKFLYSLKNDKSIINLNGEEANTNDRDDLLICEDEDAEEIEKITKFTKKQDKADTKGKKKKKITHRKYFKR